MTKLQNKNLVMQYLKPMIAPAINTKDAIETIREYHSMLDKSEKTSLKKQNLVGIRDHLKLIYKTLKDENFQLSDKDMHLYRSAQGRVNHEIGIRNDINNESLYSILQARSNTVRGSVATDIKRYLTDNDGRVAVAAEKIEDFSRMNKAYVAEHQDEFDEIGDILGYRLVNDKAVPEVESLMSKVNDSNERLRSTDKLSELYSILDSMRDSRKGLELTRDEKGEYLTVESQVLNRISKLSKPSHSSVLTGSAFSDLLAERYEEKQAAKKKMQREMARVKGELVYTLTDDEIDSAIIPQIPVKEDVITDDDLIEPDNMPALPQVSANDNSRADEVIARLRDKYSNLQLNDTFFKEPRGIMSVREKGSTLKDLERKAIRSAKRKDKTVKALAAVASLAVVGGTAGFLYEANEAITARYDAQVTRKEASGLGSLRLAQADFTKPEVVQTAVLSENADKMIEEIAHEVYQTEQTASFKIPIFPIYDKPLSDLQQRVLNKTFLGEIYGYPPTTFSETSYLDHSKTVAKRKAKKRENISRKGRVMQQDQIDFRKRMALKKQKIRAQKRNTKAKEEIRAVMKRSH